MKNKNLLIALTGFGMLLNTASAHAGSVGVFGPNGEVISYEKKSDGIHVRVCQKNSLTSEIESDSGCTLAEGTSEVVLSEKDFRTLVKTRIARIDKSALSAAQKTILERALTDLPSLDAKRQQLKNLQAQLKKIQAQLKRLDAFKGENPHDYDLNEEKNFLNEEKTLKDHVNSVKDSLAGYAEIIDAKNQVSQIIDQLITDMDGKPMKQVFRRSQGGTGIAYYLLRGLASVEACDPAKVATAESGYICRADLALWLVNSDTYAGKRVYTDLKSGLKVTETVATKINQYDAEKQCKDGFSLPTGYPSSQNGTNGFPKQDSEFVRLESDHIRDVVPGMNDNKWFWSSSVLANNTYFAYDFFGFNGYIDYDNRGYVFPNSAVVCVGSR